MNRHIITHKADADGWVSKKIIQEYYPNAIYHDLDYADPLIEIIDGDSVIIADFSYTMDEMLILDSKCESFLWIDHHIGAMHEYYDRRSEFVKMQTVLCDKLSAMGLTWIHFKPYEPIPKNLKMLGCYDTGKYGNPDVKAFQLGFEANLANDWMWESLFNTNITVDIIEEGRLIQNYTANQNKQLLDMHMQLVNIRKPDVDVPCVCSPKNPYSEEHMIKYPFVIFWIGIDGGKRYKVSLRSDPTKFDCSKLAKSFGGGGHKGAAGFYCDKLPWLIG